VGGQLHARTALLSRKKLPTPTGYDTKWVPELVWRQCQEKSLTSSGIEPQILGRKIRSLVNAMTELSRLPLPCKSVKCIVTCISVTTGGVWNHYRIYWTL
jgi:hypothetical protein